MIFLDKKTFGVHRALFLGEPQITYATFSSIKTCKGNTPSDSTGIDSKLQKAVVKAFSEHLERRKMGIYMDMSNNVLCYNFTTKTPALIVAKNFAYGYNKMFGWNDTTGTAAGYNSDKVIRKACYELLEKNEMLLFWYKDLGEYVEKNDYINCVIRELQFSSERVEIFSSRNLCNRYTFFTICISRGRVVSSGVCLDDKPEHALRSALYEARLLEWQNKNNPNSNINKLSDDEMKSIIQFIDNKKKRMKKFKDFECPSDCFRINEWIKEMYIGLLSMPNDYSPVTVKCISKELFNCIPKRHYILDSKEKEILKRFGITEYEIAKQVECILL